MSRFQRFLANPFTLRLACGAFAPHCLYERGSALACRSSGRLLSQRRPSHACRNVQTSALIERSTKEV
jgi:hypothetical protein